MDYFNGVNQQRNYAVGDELLVVLPRLLRDSTRASQALAPHGGNEAMNL